MSEQQEPPGLRGIAAVSQAIIECIGGGSLAWVCYTHKGDYLGLGVWVLSDTPKDTVWVLG